MNIIDGGVTAAKGFSAYGLRAGIKNNDKKDMAIVISEKPCAAAGTFTTNVVKAAPVKWDYKVVNESEYAQAIVVNSGVAHACTGEEGYGYCKDMAKAVADTFSLKEDSVLVASTGVMIHPNMATMLGFVTTDIDIEDGLLKKALKETVNDTFNMISVDGDTSTNDSVLLLANGMSGNAKITKEDDNYLKFKEALMYVNRELAKKIAGDGEGATCLFEVQVVGAESKEQAVTLSKSIVTSSLTKAAIFGHDANWGRILCAMGYSGAQFDPEKVDIYFESENGKLKIVEDGTSTGYSEEEATKILSSEHVKAIADVKMGNYEATAYGCDLTFDYVKINADYRS